MTVAAGGTEFGLALAALSALSTAGAHALLKAGRDKLAVQAWIRLVGLGFALPLVVLSPLPGARLLGWIAGAAAIHALYQALLIRSYTWNDFAAAYPVARGTGALLAAGGGLLLLGERIPLGQVAGILLVVAGIAGLTIGARLTRHGLAVALATGALTAAYSLVDARAMRIAPEIGTFLGWFFLADAVSMPTLFALRRAKGTRLAALWSERRTGVLAGIGALASFVPALIAYRYAPTGAVNALRETSILGALIAGRLWLGERPGWWHWLAGITIAVGAVAIVAG
ncbi:MAG: EamA family transporter [Novosphingobium sp.]